MVFFLCATTVCIRIVADFGTRIFQVTSILYAGYNAYIYNYFGYYFYTLLATVFILHKFVLEANQYYF